MESGVGNLPAQARVDAASASIPDYRIALDLTAAEASFTSETVVTFTSPAPGLSTFATIEAENVMEITFNDEELSLSTYDGHRIPLQPRAGVNHLRVRATISYTKGAYGLHRSVNPDNGEQYLVACLAPDAAPRLFAVVGDMTSRIHISLVLRTPPGWITAPQAAVVAEEPESTTWSLRIRPAITPRRLVFATGDYQRIVLQEARPTVSVVARRAIAERMITDRMAALISAGIAGIERVAALDDAPLDLVIHVGIGKQTFSGPGCIVLGEECLPAADQDEVVGRRTQQTVLRALALQLFGVRVVPATPGDAWAVEGPATWLAQDIAESYNPDARAAFAIEEKARAINMDQNADPPLVVDPQRDDRMNWYLGATGGWAKSAAVMRQAVALIGVEATLTALRAIMDTYDGGAITVAELLAALSAASGIDMEQWASPWLYHAGLSHVSPVVETDIDAQGHQIITRASLSQTAPPGALRTHVLGVTPYFLDNHELSAGPTTSVTLAGDTQELSFLRGTRAPSVLLVNTNDTGYIRMHLDARAREVVRWHLETMERPVDRAVFWRAAWQAVRDGDIHTTYLIDRIMDCLATETQTATRAALLYYTDYGAHYYFSPPIRRAAQEVIAEHFRMLSDYQPVGSDARLQLFRACTNHARQPDLLQWLEDVLHGRIEVPDLQTRTTVRWSIMEALALNGRADFDDISAELEHSGDVASYRSAAAAMACLPSPEDKAICWERLTAGPELPLGVVRHATRGFRRAIDRTVLLPFAAEYFEIIDKIWAANPLPTAITLAAGLYPRTVVDLNPALVIGRGADKASEVSDPILARILRTGSDEARRDLNCQKRDRQAGATANPAGGPPGPGR